MTTKTPAPVFLPGPHPGLLLAHAAFAMHRAESPADWNDVRALRHRSLRERCDIPDTSTAFPDDRYDHAPGAMGFLLTRHGRAVGATRSNVAAPRRRDALPCSEVFGREIAASVGPESTLVEASLTVVDPDLRGDRRLALFHLFKAHLLRCALEDADWLLVAVTEARIGFYRRMFNMEILSGSEHYPRLALPRVLMGLEWRREAPVLFKRIPTLAVSAQDLREFRAGGPVAFPAEPPCAA